VREALSPRRDSTLTSLAAAGQQHYERNSCAQPKRSLQSEKHDSLLSWQIRVAAC